MRPSNTKYSLYLVALVTITLLVPQQGMAKERSVEKTSEIETTSVEQPAESRNLTSDREPASPGVASSPATGEEINWEVIGSGGVVGAISTNYKMSGTVGQTAVGPIASVSNQILQGFWQDFTSSGGSSCCLGGTTGNVNYDGADVVDVSDLTKLVNHLFVTFEALDCPAEANTNGDPGCVVDVSDLTKLVNHLFVTFEALAACNPSCG